MGGPGSSGKRKRAVDIDLTADSDSDDAFDPAPPPPAKASKSNPSSQASGPSSQIRTDNKAATHRTPNRQSSQNGSVYLSGGQHPENERTAWLADDEGDIDEIIGSSQDAAISTDQLQHYGDLDTKIVGCQYYKGMASPGETILIRREPGNPYDSNAIRLDNVYTSQIGHIPRRTAEKLSKYMDNRWLHLEGQLAGYKGQFDCPLKIGLFGPDPDSADGKRLIERMTADKLPIKAIKEAERAAKQREKDKQQAEKKRLAEARRAAATGQGGRVPLPPSGSQYANQNSTDGSSQPVMGDILEASERFDTRNIGQTSERYGLKEEALEKMPMASQPEGIKTKMLPYQLQALKWLLGQESPSPPRPGSTDCIQLWKVHDNKQGAFTNIATNFSVVQAPKLASGGILADDMGLGKTLELISLLVSDNAKGKTGPTLIVAPLSVMSNWSDQIARHVHETHALNIYTYHAAGRVAMKPADFAQYDVVITTYQTLASDYMPRGKGVTKPQERGLRSSGLYSIEWRRIILDEGHTVRNPQSKGAAAVLSVAAKSKWVLTGTPIVNSLKDLYCLLRFVGITGGLETLEIFNSVLVRPLKNGSQSAADLLQAVMRSFTLRRKKEMPFIDLKLPGLEEFVHRIEFTENEKKRYEALQMEAKGMLTKYEKKGAAGGNKAAAFQSLLEIILRMRQCCNHWRLCSERMQNLMAQLEESKTVALTPENQKALQDLLQVQIESQEDCAVCLETLHNPVITTCAHAFGRECINRVIETQHKCPMCRAELKDDTCLVEPANECGDEAKDDEMDLNESSSKLEALLRILGATKSEGDKTIIFSQWTRYLDVVEARLLKEGYKYCRLDGTMSAQQRDNALRALENDPDCTIMLASLGVCAVGLNLTAANQIILSDSWWAPAIEDQAVDRVHRLGQKKETRVFRLVMDKTIEDEVLRIQADKRALMKLALSEKSNKRDAVKQGRLADIQRLLHR